MAGLEYEPLQISDNTEVKVPLVSAEYDKSDSSETECWLRGGGNNDETFGDGQWEETEIDDSYSRSVFYVNEHDLQNYTEYKAILKLYREMPKDMCVVEIMNKFGSCESDLELVRNNYFNHLKN